MPHISEALTISTINKTPTNTTHLQGTYNYKSFQLPHISEVPYNHQISQALKTATHSPLGYPIIYMYTISSL